MITCNSYILSTLNIAVLLLFFLTLLISKVFLILISNLISLIWICIEKLRVTLYFNLVLSALYIEIINKASASENLIINHG